MGKGIADPIAMIWAGGMLLDFLGQTEAASLMMRGIEATVLQGTTLTPDLGGKASTAQAGQAICEQIERY